MTWRRTQSSITKYVPDTEHSPTPDTSPPAEGARPSNTPSNKPGTASTHHQARGLHPQEQSSAPRVRPRGSVGQGGSRAPVRPSRPPPAHPCICQGRHPRACQVLRVRPRRSAGAARRAAPTPSQEYPSQQPRPPRESPPLWRNVGPTLGSIRRLAEGLSKAPWAIAMRLSDPLPSMWGVRHHDSPPVSEWCS